MRFEPDLRRDFTFNNCERSRKLIECVWQRNDEGKIFVDWLDVLQEFDWEIIFA